MLPDLVAASPAIASDLVLRAGYGVDCWVDLGLGCSAWDAQPGMLDLAGMLDLEWDPRPGILKFGSQLSDLGLELAV